ncbi:MULTISPECIES: hypothetical protein [Bacillus]|uniref:hypothetical protein n=1 Tax=Bacillus TaxID=1386 RepID=UPI000BF9ACA7|nr:MULTISPECIES: hypothetical protein [Bacillus]MDM5040903.1 hypothetical protein [Bacillus sp. OR-18]PER69231.1 hypothetical protein CN502_10165 [Bacillus cereus]PFB23525.1 hypothetical protein CN408_00100 [Bacillus cereus]PFC67908.1 hypothetical protein CN266_04350 [Bacillus cereus]PFL41857.1 hypothetical protein COJ06_06300 [Bacillus cereus]
MKFLSKKILTGLIVGAMSISVLTPSINAEINDSQKEANSTAQMIEKNTGIDDVLNNFKMESKETKVIENASGTVNIPTTLNSEPITIKDRTESLHISLPELNSSEVIQTNNGTLIYQDENQPADLAVQTTKDGVRSLIKIKNQSAPKEYEFAIDIPNGGKLVSSAEYLGQEFDTGEVFIVDAENIIQSVFMPAWAKDANGNPVSTHYKVDGNKLIQVVDFDENTAFPVIADPDWIKIGKCSAALAAFVGGNLIAVSKLLKIKKYINALGGFGEAAKLLVQASTWEERMRVGGQALVGLAGELTGATGVWAACK